MIKYEDIRKQSTVFINGDPYDTSKSYVKKFKLFGLTLWQKKFEVNGAYADFVKIGEKKKPGFIQGNEKDN